MKHLKKYRMFVALVMLAPVCAGADWPQFRGVYSASVADDGAPPIAFDVASGKNIAWKADLSGRGRSSPIVVAGRVIVTASSGANEDRLHVFCFDATSGKPLWERKFWATGRTLCHPMSAIAAPTPASDGQRIFAFYSSNDLVCLDLDGNLQWLRGLTFDYPAAANDVGMSSSPVVSGSAVIVQIESKGDSFAAALDTATGATRWRLERPREMNWCSPTLLPGKTTADDVLLLQSPTGMTTHEPASGRVLWSFDKACNGIPSAVGRDGVIYVPAEGLTALRHPPAASTAEVLWTAKQLEPGNSSPIVHDGLVYVVNRAGTLTCADAATGEIRWRLRLKGTYWATPIVAGGHLFAVNQDGVVLAVKLGAQGEIAAESTLGEQVFGSLAVAGGGLYLRSDAHLWKIAERP